MAQRKGQTGNPHGRPRGKPNKVTIPLREFVSELINDNRKTIKADLGKIDPQQRLVIIERLMAFVIPKMQSIDASVQIAEEYNQLERLLNAAPDEAIQKIADKIMKLSNINKLNKNE